MLVSMLVSILEYLVSDGQINTPPYVCICSKVYDNYHLVEIPIKVLFKGSELPVRPPGRSCFSKTFPSDKKVCTYSNNVGEFVRYYMKIKILLLVVSHI